MNEVRRWSALSRILAGVALIGAGALTGAALGLLYVKLFVPKTGMGFDALADALGGLVTGALIGLVIAGVLVATLSVRRQWTAVRLALIITVLALAGLFLAAPKSAPAPSSLEPAAKDPSSRRSTFGSETGHRSVNALSLEPERKEYVD